jgi:uncharacterized damage-inducible protein DinB
MEQNFIHSLITIFERDLTTLEKEINLYPDEESLWKVSGDIKNSGGTLCLHLCGNLQHFIGAVLGNSGYRRNRENEFAARYVSRMALLEEISQTKVSVTTTLQQLDPSILEKEYPAKVFDVNMTTTYFLIHLSAHLGYHLGQVNYHRRLVTG